MWAYAGFGGRKSPAWGAQLEGWEAAQQKLLKQMRAKFAEQPASQANRLHAVRKSNAKQKVKFSLVTLVLFHMLGLPRSLLWSGALYHYHFNFYSILATINIYRVWATIPVYACPLWAAR